MAPRSRRQAAARAQPAGNAYGVLYDDYESHSDVYASAEELISALDGYTPSPCTQCFKSTTAMVALSAAMREMRGVLERFEKSASPRIDLMLLDNTMAVEAINEHLDVLAASSQDMKHTTTKNLFTIATGLDSISQMTENNVHSTEELKEAWRISRAEIAALKDVVAGLAKQISELKATTLRPPSPTADTTISSAVEEMSYKSWMLSGGSVGCATIPSPTTTAEPNTPPSDVSTAASEAPKEWKIVKGKRGRRKSKGTGSGGSQRTAGLCDNPLMEEDSARRKKAHQPIAQHHRASQSWADVVRGGGINVQIVLGNDNLRLPTPVKSTGQRRERRGGTAGRERQRGVGGRGDRRYRGQGMAGNAGPVLNAHGAALGDIDSTEVDGVGKERDKEVPGAASPERTGPQDRTAGGSG